MMAKEITAGIGLNLNDNFSEGIKNAGDTTQEFAQDTKAAFSDVEKSADNFSEGIKNAGDATQEFAQDTKAAFSDVEKSAETFADKTLGATDKSRAAFEKFTTKTAGNIKNFIKNSLNTVDDAVDRFGTKTLGVINKIDGIVHGAAVKIGAIGLTFSLGAATKDIMEFESQVVLMGTVAGMTDEEILQLKRDIYDVSHNANIKLDYTKLQEASSVITDLTAGRAHYKKGMKQERRSKKRVW